jgi:hypothetical protein
MSDFTIRSESVDVEQIMKQIRQRILEKRGADYTEDQIRELASVRLEKFLDPKNLRSDLLEQFRKSRPAFDAEPPKIHPPYAFDDQTLFASHRGLMRLARKLLNPLLKLMFNPNTLNQILHSQAQFNVDLLKREARRKIEFDRSRAEWNALYYEVLHNLVLETTRLGIEVQNLRMKTESLSSRLDFSERRVRALEGVVQYRPEVVRGSERRDDRDEEPRAAGAQSAQAGPAAQAAQGAPGGIEGFVPGAGQGDGSSRRRRRRRRGRRGQGASGASGALGASAGASGAIGSQPDQTQDQFDEGPDDEGSEEMEAANGFDEPMDAGAEAQEALEGRGAQMPVTESVHAPDASPATDTPQEPETPEVPAPSVQPPDRDDDIQ